MDKNQETMKKKNMSTKIVTTANGGGLSGIILLCGALASAAFVSTFAFKFKQKFNKPSKVVNKDSGKFLVDEGLSFLVSDSLSPRLHYRPSNGTESEIVSGETAILDETREVNGEKDEEFDVVNKAREGLLCDESGVMEEISVLVANGSLLLESGEMKDYGLLEENAVLKVDYKIMMANSDKVGVVVDDQNIQFIEDEVCDGSGKKIYGNNKLDDQADVLERMPAEKCNETREDVFVEVPQSGQLGIDYDYHKPGDECDGNGQILVEKREELVEAAVVDKIRADNNRYKGGEESDDDMEDTNEKGEVLVGNAAANWIQLSEELESSTMYGGQDIMCSNGTIIDGLENCTCYVRKADLLSEMDISSLLKPADHDHVESQLVIEDREILEGKEANETEDRIQVDERGQTLLVKANDDNKIYRRITNDKSEDADEIGVITDQQMQPCEEYQKDQINEDQKYSSVESLPDTNSFLCNGCEEQEFSFPLLDSPPYFNFGNLIKNDSSKTALSVDVKPLIQSAKNDEMKRFSDGSENDAVEGEETPETGVVDIGQQTELSELNNFNNGSKIDKEALEMMIQTENFELENNQQSPLNGDNNYGNNVNREEEINGDFAEEDEEENSDNDEEDSVDGSSETTRDSSLDSNAEAIWPVESVQELLEKVIDRVHANNHNYMEIERVDSNVNFNRRKLEEEVKENFDMDFSNKFTAEITTPRQPTNFLSLKYLFLSLMVPFLLVLWLLSSQISLSGLSRFHLQ
ncbi:hypothetical protein AgCh_036160 [Apium graveolens]